MGALVLFNPADEDNPNGSFSILVFDNENPVDYHVSLPDLDGSPEKGWTYKGLEVVADIHTHSNNHPVPIDDDRKAYLKNNLPGIIITTSNQMGYLNPLFPEGDKRREGRPRPIPTSNNGLIPIFNSLRRK